MRPTLFLLLVAPAAVADDWTRFRGPNGQGVVPGPAPVKWSATENVRWAVDVPADGWSSPVVAGGKVFVTGTTAGGKSCHVLGFDADTGNLLWDTHVFDQGTPRKEGKNSYATPTPAVVDGTVFAVFGEGGIAAVDAADGTVKWTFTGIKHYS
jgi:outer membrane protein assembly factor BamB